MNTLYNPNIDYDIYGDNKQSSRTIDNKNQTRHQNNPKSLIGNWGDERKITSVWYNHMFIKD